MFPILTWNESSFNPCYVTNLDMRENMSGIFNKEIGWIYFLSMLPNLLIYLRYLGTWGDEIIEEDFLKKAKKTAYHSSFLWTSNMIRLMVLMAVILSHPQRQEFQFSLWKIILPPRFHRIIILACHVAKEWHHTSFQKTCFSKILTDRLFKHLEKMLFNALKIAFTSTFL